jgi:glucarate dehydratase
MKITDLRVHSIAIADPPLRSSYGLHAPYALRTILELESDDGIIGINETYGGEVPAAALLNIKHKLIDANPFRITGTLNPEMQQDRSGRDGSQTY